MQGQSVRTPQLDGPHFLTDGGLETTLVYQYGLDLPSFAAFPLVLSADGRENLRRYFRPFLDLARERGLGFVLDTPTWRANPDWGAKLGYAPDELKEANRQAVAFIAALRESQGSRAPIILNGVIGPRGDGYRVGDTMTPGASARYHADQIAVFAEGGLDMASAITMNYVEEAVGIATAARQRGLPIVISFTVETDGMLPSGQSLAEAIMRTDQDTNGYPAYYMINCAHPSHFEATIASDEAWVQRLGGLRANASPLSHAELDAATELDAGNPVELGADYRRMVRSHVTLKVLGGCCGTDHRHVRAICDACLG